MIAAPLRAWNTFWFGPTSARPLGAYRVVLGAIALLNLALMAPDVDTWLSDAGRLRGTEAAELAGPMRWSPLLVSQDPFTARCVFAAAFVSAVVFTIGWHTRAASVALYALMLTIHHRNIETTSGADCLLMAMLFLMMLSPCGASYSLDARRREKELGAPIEPLIPAWPMRLVAIQITIVYFCTALLKSQGKAWIDGSAVHYILNNGEARRFTLGLTSQPLITCAMTLGTLLLEFALPFLLWVKAARPWMIAGGILLHAGILLTVNIPIFGELMMAGYIAFLTPAEFFRVVKLVNGRRSGMQEPPQSRAGLRVDAKSSGSRPHRSGQRTATRSSRS